MIRLLAERLSVPQEQRISARLPFFALIANFSGRFVINPPIQKKRLLPLTEPTRLFPVEGIEHPPKPFEVRPVHLEVEDRLAPGDGLLGLVDADPVGVNIAVVGFGRGEFAPAEGIRHAAPEEARRVGTPLGPFLFESLPCHVNFHVTFPVPGGLGLIYALPVPMHPLQISGCFPSQVGQTGDSVISFRASQSS